MAISSSAPTSWADVLRSFQIAENGRLMSRAAQPLPPAEFAETGAPPLPLGLAVHPTEPLLYVDFVTINRSVSIATTTRASFTSSRACQTRATACAGLLVNKAGTRLYASNTGDPSVSVYRPQPRIPTEPIEIQQRESQRRHRKLPAASSSSSTRPRSFLHVVTQADTADLARHGQWTERPQRGPRRQADRGPVVANHAARAQHGAPAGRGGTLTHVTETRMARPSQRGARKRAAAVRNRCALPALRSFGPCTPLVIIKIVSLDSRTNGPNHARERAG